MLCPETPANEALRQKALDEQELLDTPAEPYLDVLVRVVRDLFGVKSVLISLIDQQRQWFKARIGADIAETPRSVSFCGHAILGSQMMIVEDAQQDPRFKDNPLVTEAPHLRFYAGQPLYSSDGYALGTLCLLDTAPREWSAKQQQLLKDMATLAEGYLQLRKISLQSKELRDELSREQRKALLDPLTQLWNRAGLDHFLAIEQIHAKEHNLRLGLLYCDLDHFKHVNDNFGHDSGDRVLWQSARRISDAMRPHDIVTRSGGEEFVVITQVHDISELEQIAERIRSKIGDSPMIIEDAELALTISIGCTLVEPPEDIRQAMQRADKALYHAKRSGRNRVSVADPSSSTLAPA